MRKQALAVPAIFLYSTFLERIQHLHPTRFSGLDDVGYIALGCLIGVLAYLVLAAGGGGIGVGLGRKG